MLRLERVKEWVREKKETNKGGRVLCGWKGHAKKGGG